MTGLPADPTDAEFALIIKGPDSLLGGSRRDLLASQKACAEPVAFRADFHVVSGPRFDRSPNSCAANDERGIKLRAVPEAGLLLDSFGNNLAWRLVGVEGDAQLDLVAGYLALVLDFPFFTAH